MKKLSVFGLLVALMMVVAACSGGGSSSNATSAASTTVAGGGVATSVTAPTTETGAGAATTVSGGGAATSTTESGTGVGAATSEVVGTPVATAEGTTVPATGGEMTPTTVTGGVAPVPVTGSTEVATGTTTASGTSVPATGGKKFGEFVRLHDLFGIAIQDSSGTSLGTIQDAIVNIPKSRVDWLVMDRNGTNVLVPWSTIAFSQTGNNAYVFSGNVSRLQNAPAFNENNIDWFSETWSQDVVNFWRGAGTGATAGGTNASGTSVPTAESGSVAATPEATSVAGTSVPNTGATGATTGNRVQIAVLASQLGNINVVESANGSVPATGGMVAGTPDASSSSNSTSGANASGTSVPATGANSSSTSVPATGGNSNYGQNVGTIVDAIVNVRSGAIPFFLLNGTNIPTTGSSNSSSTMGTPEANSTSTSGSMSSTPEAGTSVPATGSTNSTTGGALVIPSRLLRFMDNNTAVLLVPVRMLSGAPSLDVNNMPTLNLGWDAGIYNFWTGGGSVPSTGSGVSATPTP